MDIAAALAQMAMGEQPLLLEPEKPGRHRQENEPRGKRGESRKKKPQTSPGKGMERFRVEVGHQHNIKPGNIVGAIANEAGLAGKYIGHIDIHATHSFVDLPKDMPDDVFQDLRNLRVRGQRMNISLVKPTGKRRTKGR